MRFWIAGLAWLLIGQGLWAQQAIRLRNRAVSRATVLRLPKTAHYILQFRAYPGADVRGELARRNVRVLGYVPDWALMVSAGEASDLSGFEIAWAGTLDAADKISPLLSESPSGVYVLIFHSDVDPDRARELVIRHGFDILPNSALLPGQVLAAGGFRAAVELAESDEVAYIMPASADLVAGNPVMACAGAVTEAGPVAQYVEVGRGWPRDGTGAVALKYFFQSFTGKLSENTVRSEIERAFAEWQRYANVSVSPGDSADAARTIAVRFARRDHGDGYPFDGAGGVLAHTFYPAPPNAEPSAGDMHLDADEDWHAGAQVDLFSVALHEAGHALGLGHSDRPGAVMYPYYRFASGLTDDDIAGIRDLYGAKEAAAPPQPPAQPPAPPPAAPPSQPPAQPPAAPPAPPSQPPSRPPADTTAPLVRILLPSSTIVSTSSASLHMSGTASDNVGVTAVKFTTSTGTAGNASGTANWSADVPLLVGNNTVTIRAYDAAGNYGWRAITVVRR